MIQPTPAAATTLPATHSESGHALIPVNACGNEVHGDAPFAGPDGVIWPNPRHAMTSPAQIVARMVEDTRTLAREKGDGAVVLSRDLVGMGWTGEQVFLRQSAVRQRLAQIEQAAARATRILADEQPLNGAA